MGENKSLRPKLSVAEKKEGIERKPVGKIILIVLLTLIGVSLLAVMAVFVYVDYIIGLMPYVDGSGQSISPEALQNYILDGKETMAPDFSGEILEPEDVALETVGEAANENGDVINILLIGHDARPGEGRARSDSMLLCSVNKKSGELILVSFLRDMYVSIPNYRDYKMNAAYAWGDMKLLNETLLVNFGVEIHGNLAVNFSAFEAVIDRLGGVEISLSAAEARYLNPYRYSQGINRLDGEAALDYARIRSIGDADFDRVSRQQKVISAILEQCRSLSVVELNDLLETVLPLVETNMEPETIKAYAGQILPLIPQLKLKEGLRIPADGTYQYAWVSDMSVLMPDLAANRRLLQEKVYGE